MLRIVINILGELKNDNKKLKIKNGKHNLVNQILRMRMKIFNNNSSKIRSKIYKK